MTTGLRPGKIEPWETTTPAGRWKTGGRCCFPRSFRTSEHPASRKRHDERGGGPHPVVRKHGAQSAADDHAGNRTDEEHERHRDVDAAEREMPRSGDRHDDRGERDARPDEFL